MTPEMREFAAQMSNPGFSIMVETRFTATNKFILDSGVSCVADLPCGYTPRGLKLADTGIRYFGMDIPAVAEEIAPAVRAVLGENRFIRYFEVDATNYDSIAGALSEVQGELLITTEGLLMYLTQSELDEVFRNIHKILEKFGGKWITTDNEILAAHQRLQNVLNFEHTAGSGADRIKPPPVPGNDFLNVSSAREYTEKMGFDLRKIPVFDFLPGSLLSLRNFPDDKRNAVRETFRNMFFWVMTVKEAPAEQAEAADIPFSVSADRSEDHLHLTISGRLDTITAPELLSVYQEESLKGDIKSVTIDSGFLTYISSAGLRVFMIMMKALENGKQFRIRNVRKSVQEILDITGFSSILECDGN